VTYAAWKNVVVQGPEWAMARGIPAETPVLVSAYVQWPEVCGDCGATYAPLVYAPGHTTHTLHRAPACPGLWHYHRPVQRNLRPLVLLGDADCPGDPGTTSGLCAEGHFFRGRQLLATCGYCNRWGPRLVRANGRWRLGMHPDCGLVTLCRRCVRAEVTVLTPWVLVLRGGQPSWRWEPPQAERA
jgi:hypothetical protein